jgi:hypothetical protein
MDIEALPTKVKFLPAIKPGIFPKFVGETVISNLASLIKI